MDRAALLALYDDQERYSAGDVGLHREEQPRLVRHVDLLGESGVVIYSRLSEDTADAAIQEQMAYFGHLGQEFEWKVFGHDQPQDLIQRLAAHGFEIDDTEAVLVHDPRSSADGPKPARDVAVRRISMHDELREVGSIKARVLLTYATACTWHG